MVGDVSSGLPLFWPATLLACHSSACLDLPISWGRIIRHLNALMLAPGSTSGGFICPALRQVPICRVSRLGGRGSQAFSTARAAQRARSGVNYVTAYRALLAGSTMYRASFNSSQML